MSKPFCCPSCGKPLGDRFDPHRLAEFLPIAGIRRAVLRILLANFAREVPTKLIADCIYASRPDGGPMTAEEGVKQHTAELRKVLRPYGLTIVGRRGGRYQGGGTHRLDWIDAPALQQRAAA